MNSSECSTNRQLAIIVDIDETICTQFDVPVKSGVGVLQRVDPHKLEVHYVTARTTGCRDATEAFIKMHRLPGSQNVHYCPIQIASFEHKRKQHESLSQHLNVIASVGDSFEEEQAAVASGVPFVQVDPCKPADGWGILADRIAEYGCIMLEETE